ncbi:hypothetical protein OG589_14360 [Sphaerisporangium sp. NBC_01403]
MADLTLTAMQDVLSDLTPVQTRTMFAYMQFFEPECFRAALDYAANH